MKAILIALALTLVGCAGRESGRDRFDSTPTYGVPAIAQLPGYFEVYFRGGQIPPEFTMTRPEIATTKAVYLQFSSDGVVRLPEGGASYTVTGQTIHITGIRLSYADARSIQIDY